MHLYSLRLNNTKDYEYDFKTDYCVNKYKHNLIIYIYVKQDNDGVIVKCYK